MNKIISDIPPFEMCDKVYFVGSTKVSVHVIKTQSGLVMIDTGYPDMLGVILNGMEALGLDPKDICAIFHSHGHIDHFGCTIKLKELSGAKTYISRIDNDIINGKLPLSWAAELDITPLPFFNCDVLVEGGECFDFGDVKLRCVPTPGHTDGVLSFFISLKDSDRPITVAMHGGVGLNSMTIDYLNKYGLSPSCRDVFRKGLHSLSNEKVDLVLGNHPEQNDTAGKQKLRLKGESVIDSTEWKRFLINTEKELDKLFEKET